jgi:type II secretory pathway component PulF
VEAGEANDELPGALRAASDMYLERVRLRMLFIRSVVPPIVFIFVTLCVLLAVVGLTMPMFMLINGLI